MYRFKFMAILAVVGSLIVSALLFVLATLETIEVVRKVINDYTFNSPYELRKSLLHYAMSRSIELIDVYLLGIVLLIFGVGLYNLIFPQKRTMLDVEQYKMFNISSIEDLKDQLSKVIMLVLIVNIFEKVYTLKVENHLDVLFLATAVALAGLAILLTHLFKSQHKNA